MAALYKELFDYNFYYNQKLVEVFVDNSDLLSEKAVSLFNHMLNAHHIWNHRIEGKRLLYGVWELHETSELSDIDKTNCEKTLDILGTIDLDAMINYKNTSGNAFSNRARDILFHIINHSTYHRAQIATEFRRCGLEPLVSDYVYYRRLL